MRPGLAPLELHWELFAAARAFAIPAVAIASSAAVAISIAAAVSTAVSVPAIVIFLVLG